MTDKEQIMIDTNKYFVELIGNGGGTIGYTVVHPEQLLRDIMKQNKQLARKTQECEEYFKQRYQEEIGRLQKSQFCVAYEKDCHKVCKQQNCAIKNSYRYRKALEEIENISDDYNRVGKTSQYYRDGFEEILDIINRAKGVDNE